MPIYNPPTPASIGAVPISREIIAGSNMTGGGALSSDVTLNASGGGGGGKTWKLLDTSGNPTNATYSYTLSGATANVDFLGLENYAAIVSHMIDVTADVSNYRRAFLSLDGATWESSYYQIQANGTNNSWLHLVVGSGSTTSAANCTLSFSQEVIDNNHHIVNLETRATIAYLASGAKNKIKGLRWSQQGGNLLAGSINVWGLS